MAKNQDRFYGSQSDGGKDEPSRLEGLLRCLRTAPARLTRNLQAGGEAALGSPGGEALIRVAKL